jgi:hypothetical protein
MMIEYRHAVPGKVIPIGDVPLTICGYSWISDFGRRFGECEGFLIMIRQIRQLYTVMPVCFAKMDVHLREKRFILLTESSFGAIGQMMSI